MLKVVITQNASRITSILLSSVVAFVYAEMTLHLRGDVVYGQSFSLVCNTTVDGSPQFAAFYRSVSASPVATVTYNKSSSICQPSAGSSPNYTYRCDNNGKEITLTVPADNLNEHNTEWRCIITGHTAFSNNNMVSVFVNVPVSFVQLSPAGSVTLRELESRILTCTTTFCRPEAAISWWKNDVNITSVSDTSVYNQNTSTGTLLYTGNRLDNRRTIVCKAWNGYGNQQISQQIILDIRYDPAGPPRIENYSDGSVFSVIENIPFTLACSVTGGNPLAYLHWNCFVLAESSTTVNQTVTSTISLTVNRTWDRQQCQCVSTQEIQGNRTAYVLIHVLIPPSLTPFTSLVKVIEGHPLELVCSAEGNPPPKLTWSPQGDDMVNQSRLYYYNISRSNHGTHICTATSTMEPTSGNLVTRSDSRSVVVNVLYSPTVKSFISPIKVIEGRPLEVECKADGNPSPQLTWSPPGEDTGNLSRLYYHSISRNNPGNHTCTAINTMEPTAGSPVTWSDSEGLVIDILYSPTVDAFTSPVKVIEGQPLVVVCSAYGNPSPQLTWNPAGDNSVNKSRLYYSAISKDKAVVHTCNATNNMVPTTGSSQSMSDSKDLIIDVLYSPTVNPFTSPVQVIQGQSLVVVCSADGNPSPQLTWNPAGEDGLDKSRLYYSAISRDKAGVHTCTATSSMVPTSGSPQPGLDSKELVIDVLYNASISRFTSKDNISVLNENSSLQLLCKVDSNPYAVISLYLENDLKLEMENARNLSYTKTAACLDAGIYTCSARNKIMNGDMVSRNIQINITCHPRIDYRRNISTEHYGPLGDNVTLEVYLIAYPEPTDITWYHREKETDMWQMFPYQSPSSNGLYSSIIIHLATERDFGYYWVNMSNDFGIYSNTYRIIPESKPGVPTNFTVTVSSPDSVKLEWTPGFWGGHPQYFIIQYRIPPDGTWVKLDQIKDSGSTKQTVTITGLQQKTIYEFHLYAENIKGSSDNTSAIVTTTEMQGISFPVGAVAGGISGALVACVCVVFVAIFLKRRGQKNEREDDDFTELKKKKRPESGLVDNPVYDFSDPKSSSSTSIGAATTEYAVVVKKKEALIDNSSYIYAQVHKELEKKKTGDVYENADLVGRNPSKENVYANSNNAKMESSGDNVYENPGARESHGPMANKDGLLYADLMLDFPTTKNGKPVIRGMEDRTEYAEIEYGKRGEPLPDSVEAKEMIKNGINNYTDE